MLNAMVLADIAVDCIWLQDLLLCPLPLPHERATAGKQAYRVQHMQDLLQ